MDTDTNNTTQDTINYVKQQKRDVSGSKRKVKILFYIYCVGSSLVMAAYFALVSLQSSLNIEGSAGTISVAASYVVSAIFGIVGTPNFLRIFGSQATLIIGEILVIVYIAGNFYPELYVLLTCSIGVGISIAIIFPAFSAFNTEFAMLYSKCGFLEEHLCISSFQGKFYGFYMASQILGNLVSYVILFSATTDHEPHIQPNVTTSFPLATQPDIEQYINMHCGANDCQEQAVLDVLSSRYNPPHQSSVILLLSVLILIASVGVCINFFVVPGCGRFHRFLDRLRNDSEPEVVEFHSKFPEPTTKFHTIGEVNNTFFIDEIDYGGKYDMNNNENELDIDKDGKVDDNNNNEVAVNKASDIQNVSVVILEDILENKEQKTDVAHEKSTWSTIKSTCSVMFSWEQFFISGLLFHYGMARAFVFSDLTRAYASCTVGIQLVGVCMAMHGAPSTILSFYGGKLLNKFGRNVLIAAASLLNLVMYFICLFWNPQTDDQWLIYLMFLGFGLCEGIWLPNTIVIMIGRYKTKQDIAMSVWNVTFMLGAAVTFAFSSMMCVNEKLYLLIGLLVFSTFTYGFSEYKFSRTRARSTASQNSSDVVDTSQHACTL
ncbi:uncharacterized protein LOC120346169 isoform X1 [Styela clava]